MNRLRRFLIRLLGGKPHLQPYFGGESLARNLMTDLSRADLEQIIVDRVMDGRDWFTEMSLYEHECRRLRQVLALGKRELGHAMHLADLEEKCKRQAREIREMQLAAERHNRESYATGLIVRCTGCDAGKPFDGEDLTLARVQAVDNVATRLRTWFNNRQHRLETTK